MENKNIKLIIALIAVFLITNGTFFVLCEKDIVLHFINRFGNWTNAALWHSSKAFLFYAGADTFYNIRYILPKTAYAFAPVKLADKLNGLLGGSTTGELEKHLAQDKYYPLYKDFLAGIHNNVSLPLYHNIWCPLLGYSGIRPIEKKIEIPIFVDRTKIEYRDRTTIRTEYRTRDNENILSVRESLEDFRSAVNQNSILLNGLQQKFADIHSEIDRLKLLERLQTLHITELQEICRLDNDWLPSNHQIVRIVEDSDEFRLSTGEMVNGLRVYYKSKSIFNSTDAEQSLLISGFWFFNTYPNICNLITGYSSNAVTSDIRVAYKNKNIDSSNCSFIDLDTLSDIKIIDYFRETAISGTTEPQNSFNLLIERVDQRLTEIAGRRSNQGSQTDNLSERSVVLDQVGEFLDTESQASINMLSRQDPAESFFNNSATNASAAATMGTLGIIGALSHLPVNDIMTIFTHFLGMSTFEPLLCNPDVVRCLVNIYVQTTGSIPGILADACNLPNPQDYLLPGESLLDQSTLNSVSSNGDNPGSYFNWKTIGIGLLACCAIGGGIYLYKNGYIDYNTASEGAKTFKETLQQKYTNFK